MKDFFINLVLLSFLYLRPVNAEVAKDNEKTTKYGTQTQVSKPPVNLEPYNLCRELNPGESLTIQETAKQSPIGLARTYSLKRDEKNPQRYIATVDIFFSPYRSRLKETHGYTTDSDNRFRVSPNDIDHTSMNATIAGYKVLNDEARAAMIARTKNCFKQSEGQLKAPDGTFLDFELKTSSSYKPSSRNIRIKESKTRSNSAEWAGNLPCGTIIHETLHLLGLCDTYHERDTIKDRLQRKLISTVNFPNKDSLKVEYSKEQKMFDCRPIAPTYNIMTSSHISTPIDRERYKARLCIYNKSMGLKRLAEAKSAKGCQNGNLATQIVTKKGLDEVLDPKNEFNFKVINWMKTEPVVEYPLAVAQMRYITKPGCHELNKTFIECSKNAYRTSAIEGCFDSLEDCSNGNFLK